jgi:hypothetical protein
MSERIEVEVNISDILDKFNRHMAETERAISFFYHASISPTIQSIDPLQTHTIAFSLLQPHERIISDETVSAATIWLFKKAFEELIIALQESLKQAYIFARFYLVHHQTKDAPLGSKEEAEQQVKAIFKKSSSLNLPDLVNQIEKDLMIQLPLKNQILSINQVRNCLVHRAGIVSEKDINDDANQSLVLDFIDLIAFFEIEGKITELNLELKKSGVQPTKVFFESKNKTKSFKKGELVKMDQNIFNGVLYTCVSFIQQLFSKIPIPDRSPT